MQRFHMKGKLAPSYIGPFKILARRGEVSYQLELPPNLSEFHDVFHVSLLRKCLKIPEQPERYQEIDHSSIDLNSDLTYREVPIKILDSSTRVTRKRCLRQYKVQWSNHSEEEATWESEDYLKKEFPSLLEDWTTESRGRDSF